MLRDQANPVLTRYAEGKYLPVPLKPSDLRPGRRMSMWLTAERVGRERYWLPDLLLRQLKAGLMLPFLCLGRQEGRR